MFRAPNHFGSLTIFTYFHISTSAFDLLVYIQCLKQFHFKITKLGAPLGTQILNSSWPLLSFRNYLLILLRVRFVLLHSKRSLEACFLKIIQKQLEKVKLEISYSFFKKEGEKCYRHQAGEQCSHYLLWSTISSILS